MIRNMMTAAVFCAVLACSSAWALEPSEHSLYLTYRKDLLVLLETRLDRRRDGYVFKYYPDGTVKTQFRYDQGRPAGLIKEFDPQGRLVSEWPIQNGQLSGVARHYHSNGQLRLEITYAEDLPNGKVTYYDENGRMTQRGEYHWGLLTKLRRVH